VKFCDIICFFSFTKLQNYVTNQQKRLKNIEKGY
jgi:hypothetical protein